jgi:hypothetical protein
MKQRIFGCLGGAITILFFCLRHSHSGDSTLKSSEMNLKNRFGSSFGRVVVVAFYHYSSSISHFWFWFFLLIVLFVIVLVSSSTEFDSAAGLAYSGFYLLLDSFSVIAENIAKPC